MTWFMGKENMLKHVLLMHDVLINKKLKMLERNKKKIKNLLIHSPPCAVSERKEKKNLFILVLSFLAEITKEEGRIFAPSFGLEEI